MKLLVFDNQQLGVLQDGQVINVTSATGPLASQPQQWMMEGVIEDFDNLRPKFEALVAKGGGVPMGSVKIAAPLDRPRHMLCAFSNYSDRPDYKGVLDFFYKGATSIVGNGDVVLLPNLEGVRVFQPEAEFAYVIGKRAKNVSESEALSYIFGYTNFVDVSARGIQGRRTTFLHKGIDDWGPMGPVITTADEIPDPHDVRVRLSKNGEPQQDYNTGTMSHRIDEQIAWLSTVITLMPGDVVSCGTHHEGLCTINEGDAIQLECEGMEKLNFTIHSLAPVLDEVWRPAGVAR